MSFPIDRKSDRVFEPGFRGEVFVCDIDRTYLATRFSTLQGLARIPFEFAIDKQDIDGMVALLKEVRRGPGHDSRSTPLYFISASPRQLRPVVERKMLLDALEFDGTTFKDWGKVLCSLRLSRLREQLGFKLTALLAGRVELPQAAQEILVGDDLESDPLAFTLYADLLAERLSDDLLLRVLTHHGVALDDAEAILGMRRGQLVSGGVRRGYIRMERHKSPDAFLDFFPGLVVCRGALQMAIGLWDAGSISREGVLRVTRDLASRGFTPEQLGDLLRDCCRRALVAPERAEVLRSDLVAHQLVGGGLALPAADPAWAEAASRDPREPWTPARHRGP
jgi:hypothetical protein